MLTPEGVATRVSYGLCNLTHAADHASWQPLVPGEPREVVLRFAAIAHAFAPGDRIRLALSSAYWPIVWPSPEPVTLTLHCDGCELALPVRPPDPADAKLPEFAEAEGAPSSHWEPLTRAESARESAREAGSGDQVARMRSGYDAGGRVALGRCGPIDLDGGDGVEVVTRIHPEDPLRARAAMRQRTELRRGDWSVAIDTGIEVSCTRDAFRVRAELRASESERVVFERDWDEEVPREGV